MANRLAVFVEDYPYSTGEPFFHAELKELIPQFDEIRVICKHAVARRKSPPDFALPEGVELIELNSRPSTWSKVLSLVWVLVSGRWFSIFKDLRRTKTPLNVYTFKVALAYMESAARMEKELAQAWKGPLKGWIWYSYWCDDAAYLLAQWQKKGKIDRSFCRVHNTDVYMERHPFAYLPFRKFIHEQLSGILAISDHARRYLWVQTPRASSRILLSRLGVPSQEAIPAANGNPFRLLSLSKISPVKNLEGLMQALSQWDGPEIEWHHFGSASKAQYGNEIQHKMQELATANPRIQVHAHGFVPPDEMMQRIRALQPHALINTSFFEGIPVSMMEVSSLGIPVLGPEICGVPELVLDGVSGFFLNPNQPESILQALKKLLALDETEYKALRQGSWQVQRRAFQDRSNFRQLVSQLKGEAEPQLVFEGDSADVGVLSVGTGNVGVWLDFFQAEGIKAIPVSEPGQIQGCKGLVLPGVGHFDAAMRRLNEPEFRQALEGHFRANKPVLGVCLGMQCLMQSSEEGEEPGLGWIPGKVISLKSQAEKQGEPWPHVGWKEAVSAQGANLGRFYFTHGYACAPLEADSIIHTAALGSERLVVGLRKGQVWGFQFHPEKSHARGRVLLREWLREAGFSVRPEPVPVSESTLESPKIDTRTLFLLVRDFPFGVCEPYLAAELQILAPRFRKVVLLAYHPGPRSERPLFALPPNVETVDVSAGMSLPNKVKAVLKSGLPHRLGRLLSDLPGPHWLGLKTALAYEAMASTLQGNVLRVLQERGLDARSGVWYAYWTDHAAYLLALWMRRNWIQASLSRTHGSDMYAERHPLTYLPHRAFIFSQLSAVAVNSSHGMHYLKTRYPNLKGRFWLARLGVVEQEPSDVEWALPVRLASLSAIIPVKNLEWILDTLEDWTGPELEWHHLGRQPESAYTDAILKRGMEVSAANPRVKICFHGYVPAGAVLNRVRSLKIHAILNSSHYEGVPVSLMEGISLGLPGIAPAVCGVPDVVVDGLNGYLLQLEDKESLNLALTKFSGLNRDGYRLLRANAVQLHRSRFLDSKNYDLIFQLIQTL
jgi:glutamine amidotransferase